MKKQSIFFVLLLNLTILTTQVAAQSFSVESILSYPFPSELVSSSGGSKIAWAMNEKGLRNIYVADGPDFKPRKLTEYSKDDGQEISSLSISADGKWIVFVRGGDHGSREASIPVQAAFDPLGAKVQVISIPFDGGKPIILAEADYP
jgi:Tol biopolymer transport system component